MKDKPLTLADIDEGIKQIRKCKHDILLMSPRTQLLLQGIFDELSKIIRLHHVASGDVVDLPYIANTLAEAKSHGCTLSYPLAGTIYAKDINLVVDWLLTNYPDKYKLKYYPDEYELE